MSCRLFFTFKAEVHSKAPSFQLCFSTCQSLECVWEHPSAVQVAECWRCLVILEQKQEKERMFTKTSIA